MRAAARAWATGGLGDDSALEEEPEAVKDARLWGMAESEVAALAARLRQGAASGFAGVWPDNCPAVDAFLAAASQWRTGVAVIDGRIVTLWIGLDYAGANVAMQARGIELDGKVMAGLQMMEVAARDVMNGGRA